MSLEQHIEGLRCEQGRLEQQAGQARQQLQDIERQLKRLNTALDALTGKGGNKRRKSGPGVTTTDVVAELRTQLHGGGKCSVEELQERVAKGLKAKGRSLAGFALRYKAALKRPDFDVCEGGIVLARAEGQAGA